MHESGMIKGIIEAITDEVQRVGAERCSYVKIEVGELAGITEDHLMYHLEEFSKGTVIDGAKIEIKIMPLARVCSSCGERYDINDTEARVCRSCKTGTVLASTGKELDIVSLETQ